MAEYVTVETDADPAAYLATIEPAGRREDAVRMLQVMARAAGWPPRMWGASMVGYGVYEYVRANGSQHRFFRTGFAPRKANMVVYLMPGVKRYADLLQKLGPHKHSVSCLYLGRLTNVDLAVLEQVIRRSVEDMDAMYPG